MNRAVLGIDTSNYTTSAALVCDGRVVENRRILLEVPQGVRGLRQSDAIFLHTKNLPEIIGSLGKNDISAVGVSVRPRDAEGSYMPCFLAGKAVASSVASLYGVPCFEFSHQAGHIMAALYSCGREDLKGKRFIAFHVSGGTTELLLVDNDIIEKKGGTLDISAGQLIDRVGVKLGMKFPCGRELEQISAPLDSVNCISHVRGLDFNLSGAENVISKMIDDGLSRGEIAAFTFKTVLRTLERLAENAIEEFGDIPIVFAGGVMSNRRIRHELSKKFNAFFAESEYSCDNAAGTALLAERSLIELKD